MKIHIMKDFLFIIPLFLFLFENHSQTSICCTKAIFIIDNSGSIKPDEFAEMKSSVNIISDHLLFNEPNTEIAIVQYGSHYNYTSNPLTLDHEYDITIPFTNNLQTLLNFNRFFSLCADHLPGSLAKMRVDNIWGPNGLLDLISENCYVKCFLFTDAGRDFTGDSYLINTGYAIDALPNYEEYNYLKKKYGFEFTVYHIQYDSFSASAGAAISSVGGSYYGSIDENINDPEGNGELPRNYFLDTTFLINDYQIENIVYQLTNTNCDSISSLSIPNVFSPNNDGTNDYFSITMKNILKIKGVIYDRWGLEMTNWNEINYSWDGKTPTGKNVPTGTYYYIIEAVGADNIKYLEKGALSLFK